jgi:hypothetical protein
MLIAYAPEVAHIASLALDAGGIRLECSLVLQQAL